MLPWQTLSEHTKMIYISSTMATWDLPDTLCALVRGFYIRKISSGHGIAILIIIIIIIISQA